VGLTAVSGDLPSPTGAFLVGADGPVERVGAVAAMGTLARDGACCWTVVGATARAGEFGADSAGARAVDGAGKIGAKNGAQVETMGAARAGGGGSVGRSGPSLGS
jgi:hypothetical protein